MYVHKRNASTILERRKDRIVPIIFHDTTMLHKAKCLIIIHDIDNYMGDGMMIGLGFYFMR